MKGFRPVLAMCVAPHMASTGLDGIKRPNVLQIDNTVTLPQQTAGR